MNLFALAFVLWLLWRLLRWATGPWRRRAAERRRLGRIKDYRLTDVQNFALALAHPMAFKAVVGGFSDEEKPALTPALVQQLRPMTLHYFGLRTDLSDAAAAQQMPGAVRGTWFRRDLEHLLPADQAQSAIALACARCAFFVRCAYLLGWLDAPLQWQVLHLNAARAADCFNNWASFGHAYAAGRTQWVTAGRGDALGRPVTEDEVKTWLAANWHPWGRWAWAADGAYR